MTDSRFTRLTGTLLLLAAAACGSPTTDTIPPAPPESAMPTIVAFVAAPETIAGGEAATLHWTTRNVTSISIADGNGDPVAVDGLDVARGSVEVRPTATTAYTLVATGADPSFGQARRTVTVSVRDEVPDAPTIEAFTASPAMVALGAEATLSWQTTGATRITLEDDAGAAVDVSSADPARGEVAVSPDRSPTTYFLVAAGPGGRATASVVVDVAGLPRITKFFVDPISPVREGGTVTVVWETLNVSRVKITRGGTTVVDTDAAAGTVAVTLADNATFELVAEGPGGTATATAAARVGPAIVAFSASERVVRAGDPIVLAWGIEGADRAVIDGPGDYHLAIPADRLASGEATVTVAARGEFLLRAFRQEVPQMARLAVEVTESPRIRDLSVGSAVVTASLDRPAPVTLSWRQDGAATCTILVNNSPVAGNEAFPCATTGTATVPVRGPSNLRLVARNAAGEHSRTVTVDTVPPAEIVAFARHPARRVAPGETVELSWSVTDADAVELTKNGLPVAIDPTAFDGSITDVLAADAVYALTARNSLGDPTVAELVATTGVPVILSAEASPSFVGIGAAFTLHWTADGGDELTITGPSGEVEFRTDDPATIDRGSARLLVPLEAGTYTFTVNATNGAGAALPVEVPVTVSDGPMIDSFTVEPAAISLGQSATLTWWATNDPDGRVPTLTLADDKGNTYPAIPAANANHGTLTVSPAAEGLYTFTLTATTPGRTPATKTATLDVSVAPVVVSFSASDELVSTEGGTVTPEVILSWESRNAVEVTLWEKGSDGELIPPPFHRVSLALGDPQEALDAGSFPVYPTVSTTFVVRARNRVGTDVFGEVRVVVDPPSVASFVATPAEILENGSTTLSWTTVNATSVELQPVAVRRLGDTFVDVSGSATAVASALSGDEDVETIQFPTGFTFPFAGVERTSIQVSSNGWAGFNTGNTSAGGYGSVLPHSSKYINFALYAADLNNTKNTPAGQVFSDLQSDAEGDFLVIQFKNWSWHSTSYTPSDLNFELILRPNGNFEYRYGTMTAKTDARASGEGASIGFQYPGTGSFGMNVVPHQQAQPGGLAGTGFAFDVRLPANGSVTVNPAATTTYTLTALNADASASAQTRVIVWKQPAITSVTTVPAPPMANRPFEIRWTATEATRMKVLDANGTVLCNVVDPARVLTGPCSVTAPTAGVASYTLVAENGPLAAPVASVTRPLTLSVLPYLGIERFEVSPQFPAAPGETVTLSWATTGAIELELLACDVVTSTCTDITPARANPAAGSTTYVVPGSTRFVLRALDVMGRTVEAETGAYIGPASVDSFTASAYQITAGEAVTLSWQTTDADRVEITPSVLAEEVTGTAPFIELQGNGGTAATLAGTTDSGRYVIQFPVGFRFPYFGTQVTGLVASVDGWISFNTSDTSSNSGGAAFPTSSTYDEVQMGLFWDDLEVVSPATVLWKLEANPPSGPRYLVVEWKNFEDYFDSSSDLNFELVLFEDGTFDFRYGQMVGDDAQGDEATIGFQSFDRTVGYTLSNDAVVPGGLTDRSWRFRPNPGVNGALPVRPQDSTTYRLCATNASTYQACREIRIVVVQPGDLLFSEALIAPPSPEAEWFELRNMSPDPIDLAIGGWAITAGSGERFAIPSTTPRVVPPGGHLVFARSDLPAVNGGLVPDVVYGTALTLDDAADALELFLGTTLVDRFAWDATWTVPAGQAIAADPSVLAPDPASNDPAAAWCPVAGTYGDGTFTGSPGTDGDGCQGTAAP
jgi:hypothetical protein